MLMKIRQDVYLQITTGISEEICFRSYVSGLCKKGLRPWR